MYIQLQRDSKVPMSQQLYRALRRKILSNDLSPHTRLPSTRQLASDLHVSRNVVLEAYDQLYAEGFTHSIHGSGTYVSENTQLSTPHPVQSIESTNQTGLRHEPIPDVIDFRPGVPDLSLFPMNRWGKLYKEVCDDVAAQRLDYYESRGSYQLRLQLTHYLQRSRGVICTPEQILITTGAAQAFTITARTLLTPMDHAVLEDPVNQDILEIFRRTQANIHPVPVDDAGIQVERLPAHPYRLLFVTPSHQFPLGGILPVQRRIALIQQAHLHQGYIIEDDYDSEFRYNTPPIQSLQSLAPDRVIYVGSFSKKLYPALRIGFIVMPPALIESLSNAKHLEDIHSPVLEQLTLARFMQQGLLDKHIRTSRKVYHQRRNYLERALCQAFGDDIRIHGNATGIHLVVHFSSYAFPATMFHHFSSHGLRLYAIGTHSSFPHFHENQLMLGYGNLTIEQISQGVQRLRAACDSHFTT